MIVASLYAQDFTEIKRLAPEGLPKTYAGELGYSVAVDGNYAVAGAPSGGVNLIHNGLVIIYKWNVVDDIWEELKIVYPDDGSDEMHFGRSVAISGNFILIGAPSYEISQGLFGAAYLYGKNVGGIDNWGLIKQITAPQGGAFGYSVSIDQNELIIGAFAYLDNVNGATGRAYIYSRDHGGIDNWGLIQSLVASDNASNDYFGFAVSIHGDNALVGAKYNDDLGNRSGSAYIFYRNQGGSNNWGETIKLVPSDGEEDDEFGASLSIFNDVVAVGSRTNTDSGSVYVYEQDPVNTSNWLYVKKIKASDGSNLDLFGTSVNVNSDNIFVGALRDNGFSGSGYIFNRNNNWAEIQKIVPVDSAPFKRFGSSIAGNGQHIFVGSYSDDDLGSGGSAYFFKKISSTLVTYEQIHKITMNGSEGQSNFFGSNVCVNGDHAIVGSDAGSAYIFSKDSSTGKWLQVKELTHVDSNSTTLFGFDVSLFGDHALVASRLTNEVYLYFKNQGGTNNWGEVKLFNGPGGFGGDIHLNGNHILVRAPGTVFIYEKNQGGDNNWGLIKQIFPSNPLDEGFGYSLDMSGDNLIVGIPSTPTNTTGQAYIFNKNEGGQNNWGEVKRIIPSNGGSRYLFGRGTSISGDYALIGSNKSAYIYSRNEGGTNNWGELKRLPVDVTFSIYNFGFKGDINGEHAVVSNPLTNVIYLYHKNQGGDDNWGYVNSFQANDFSKSDRFGESISMSSNTILVGAIFNDLHGRDSGSAYIFQDYCQNKLSIPDPDNTFHQAEQTINSGGKIFSDSNVSFGAATICLDNGFEVQGNAQFLADIDPCIDGPQVGQIRDGGIIFYVAPTPTDLNGDGSHDLGLVCSLEDLMPNAAWGCYGTSLNGADETSIGTGYQNTQDIIINCSSPETAASMCNNLELNGYDDWFLPSKDELNLMWSELADSDGDGTNSGPTDVYNLSGFQATSYLSSSESNATKALRINFSSGTLLFAPKSSVSYVTRPVRAF